MSADGAAEDRRASGLVDAVANPFGDTTAPDRAHDMPRSVDARVEKVLEASGALVWDVDLVSGESTWWIGARDEPSTGSEPVTDEVPAPGDAGLRRSGPTTDAQEVRGAVQAAGADVGSTRRLAPLAPADRERVVTAALAALDDRDRVDVTRRVELEDGTARWFDMTVEVSAGPDGAGTRVLGTALDVTCTEEALDRLRLHSQQSEELVVRVRVGARLAFEYVSPASLFFTGYSPRELYDNGIAYALNAVEPATLAAIQHDGMLGSLDGKTYEFPTRRKDGSVLWVRASLREHIDESGDLLLEITVRDIGQTRALELEVSKLRLTDTLTGVSSRQALEESWPNLRERARATQSWTVVAHVDVDRFGLVNSGLGIAAGDDLLRAVARRLAETVGDDDLVIRLGSDDFVVVVTGATSRVGALAIAARLAGAFREPVRSSGHSTFVSVSVGASVIPAAPWSRADGLDVRLAEAEVAMRVVKQRGGNGIEVFADEMRTEARDKVELLAALRDGIETGAFVLHYQPIVDMRTMGVVGAEALVRWTHPTRGLLSPAEFVGLAEETGWIVPIGAWVVEHACAAATTWPRVRGQKVKVAVNLSARQLNSVDLVGAVGAALSRSGLEPGDLILEITETAFIHDFEAAIWTLRRMGDLGVHLALDDFGTGYSSLAYLVQLPIDRVKIDRSMVAGLRTNPHSRAVVAGIVGMAEALGIEVIAEGVERPDQVDALRSLGCSLAQGYYFAHPLPLRDMVALLDGEVPWKMPFEAS